MRAPPTRRALVRHLRSAGMRTWAETRGYAAPAPVPTALDGGHVNGNGRSRPARPARPRIAHVGEPAIRRALERVLPRLGPLHRRLLMLRNVLDLEETRTAAEVVIRRDHVPRVLEEAHEWLCLAVWRELKPPGLPEADAPRSPPPAGLRDAIGGSLRASGGEWIPRLMRLLQEPSAQGSALGDLAYEMAKSCLLQDRRCRRRLRCSVEPRRVELIGEDLCQLRAPAPVPGEAALRRSMQQELKRGALFGECPRWLRLLWEVEGPSDRFKLLHGFFYIFTGRSECSEQLLMDLLHPQQSPAMRTHVLAALSMSRIRQGAFESALATTNSLLAERPNDPFGLTNACYALRGLGENAAFEARLVELATHRAAERDPSIAFTLLEHRHSLRDPRRSYRRTFESHVDRLRCLWARDRSGVIGSWFQSDFRELASSLGLSGRRIELLARPDPRLSSPIFPTASET